MSGIVAVTTMHDAAGETAHDVHCKNLRPDVHNFDGATNIGVVEDVDFPAERTAANENERQKHHRCEGRAAMARGMRGANYLRTSHFRGRGPGVIGEMSAGGCLRLFFLATNREVLRMFATSDSEVVRVVREVADRCCVGYSAIAAFVGVSPVTARVVLATGKLPQRQKARRAFIEFATKNADAKTRTDLQIVGG